MIATVPRGSAFLCEVDLGVDNLAAFCSLSKRSTLLLSVRDDTSIGKEDTSIGWEDRSIGWEDRSLGWDFDLASFPAIVQGAFSK